MDQIIENRGGNSNVKRRKLIKWEFYFVLAEELMTYVDTTDDHNSGPDSNVQFRTHAMIGHIPAPYFSFWDNEITNRPLYMICYMDEMAKAQVM